MESYQSPSDPKRDLFLISFNTTIKQISDREQNLINIQKWFITLWTAALGFGITNHFQIIQFRIILLAITISFLGLHLVLLGMRQREAKILETMEDYLMNISQEQINTAIKPLYKIVTEMEIEVRKKKKVIKKRVISRYGYYFKEGLSNWQDTTFYYIFVIASCLLPQFITTHS